MGAPDLSVLQDTGKDCYIVDVVATECSAAILEAAEIKRQVLGQKQSGRVPLQPIGKKKSKMNSLQVEMHALLLISI